MKRKPDFEESSGNVFADLGFRNSKQEIITVTVHSIVSRQGRQLKLPVELAGYGYA
jgi:hypothetical protein